MGVLDDAIREHLDLKRRRGADPAEVEKAEREALGPVRREGMSAPGLGGAEPTGSTVADAPSPAASDFEFAVGPVDDDVDSSTEPETGVLPSAAPRSEEPDASPAGIAGPHYSDGDFDDVVVADAPVAESDFDLPADRPIAAMPEPKPKRRHLFGRRHHEAEADFGANTPLPDELPDDDPFADEPENMAARETEAEERVSRAESRLAADEPTRPAVTPPPLQITPEAEPGHTVEYDVEQAFAEEDEVDEDILEETPDFLADTPDHDRLWFEQKPPPDFDFDN